MKKKVTKKLHLLTCIDFIGIKAQAEYKKQIDAHTSLYKRYKILLRIFERTYLI